ncbi:MAG: class I SAM-dependent methyltransferase [Chthoniobacterales bacterium]
MRVPVVILFGAVRHASLGFQTQVFGHSLRSLSAPRLTAPAEICEFNSLADFESAYVRLAGMLGRAGTTPSPDELEFLRSIAERRPITRRSIGQGDYLFLTAFVGILAPQRVVEIGTLTGFSAGVIAAALRRRHGTDGASWVDTIDIRAECAIDKMRPSGFEIPELFPELVSMIRLHTPADSSVVSQLAGRDELELAFIDADHRHPLPLLDLLRLAPCVRGDGWILLHDIQWGTIGRKAAEAGQKLHWGSSYGAEWLFDRWPFQKISGGNIGAVQLPEQKSALIPFTLRMMSIRFETAEKQARSTRRALYESLGQLV